MSETCLILAIGIPLLFCLVAPAEATKQIRKCYRSKPRSSDDEQLVGSVTLLSFFTWLGGVLGIIFVAIRFTAVDFSETEIARFGWASFPWFLLGFVCYRAKSRLFDTPLKEARAIISREVTKHLDELARRRIQKVRTDRYGLVDMSAWSKECQYFIDNIIIPQFSEKQHVSLVANGPAILHFHELLDDVVAARSKEIEDKLRFEDSMSPEEFEVWVAARLRSLGWSARTTKTSGDQGADVIAEKSGVTCVVQCKLHTGKVGNKAVQEAFGARRHYGASESAVVTNSDFTTSARELAATTNVLLLHYSELERLEELVRHA